MPYYDWVPSYVSYDELVKVLEVRTVVDKSYDERIYLMELTHSLLELARKTHEEVEHKHFFGGGF